MARDTDKKKQRSRAARVARALTDEDIARSHANEQRAVRAGRMERTDPARAEQLRGKEGSTTRMLRGLARAVGTEDVAQASRLQRRAGEIERVKHSPGYTVEVPKVPEPGDADLNPSNPASGKHDGRKDPCKPTVR
jgi:hypothetical protein